MVAEILHKNRVLQYTSILLKTGLAVTRENYRSFERV